MKKDHIRDYATAAFRFYALLGLSSDEYKKLIWEEAISNKQKSEGGGGGISNPTESDLIYAETKVQEKMAILLDIEAVEKTIKECEQKGYKGKYIKQMIEKVYFYEPKTPLRKGEIHNRTVKTCNELNIGERLGYKYLKDARKLFAFNRGLRDDYLNIGSD